MSSSDDYPYEEVIDPHAKKSQKGRKRLEITALIALLLIGSVAVVLGYFFGIMIAVYIGVPLFFLVLVLGVIGYAYDASTPLATFLDDSKQSLSSLALAPKEALKIVLIGDACVGKTALMKCYVQDKYTDDYISTIGIEFGCKPTDEGNRVHVWDTAGQLGFLSLIQPYFCGAHAILIAYNITDRRTFNSVGAWIKRARAKAPDACLVLVGCQCDRANQRQVTYEEAEALAKEDCLLFFETSAKTGLSVSEAFETGLPSLGRQSTENLQVQTIPVQTVESVSPKLIS